MIRLFKHYVPHAVLLLGLIDFVLLLLANDLAWTFRASQTGVEPGSLAAKGRMSFVGPRPEVPQFVNDLESELPYYAERHMVKLILLQTLRVIIWPEGAR